MDRKYIENQHVVERYLSGELTVRDARDFEKYCLENPAFLNALPIPVRLKARLSRRPHEGSETGIFQAIPSSATHAAMANADEEIDADEGRGSARRAILGLGQAASRIPIIGLLLVALIVAICGLIAYGMHASSLAKQIGDLQRDMRESRVQAPGSVETWRLQPVRGKPAEATLAPGWPVPPRLLELRVDVSEGNYNQFQITIDRIDGTRILQIRRIARDSNRELRLALNSSAFGPGEYLFRIDGYTWRGRTEEIGWVRMALE